MVCALVAVVGCSGCFNLPLDPGYTGPPARPPEVEAYYHVPKTALVVDEKLVSEKERFRIKRITIQNDYAPLVVDYFERYQPSDSLILVFPVLGGKNIIAEYFARYFARNGFDAAIVNRNNDFKKPENFERLEEIFRLDLMRDRVALNFFEEHYGKKRFGSFGISRGGINVAITAGVDSRLQYNVIAMGGTDLVSIFRDTAQSRINKYKAEVMKTRNLTPEQFYKSLDDRIKTDPKNLAKYMDARNTLMLLAMFDKTVPIKYGRQLREQIGNPRTVFLAADHFIALLYTQFLKFFPPTREFTILPIDYVEGQALEFFRQSFAPRTPQRRAWYLAMLRAPLDAVGKIYNAIVTAKTDTRGDFGPE